MITAYDLDAIWMEGEPQASAAFNRLARDHGVRFAEVAREFVLADKMLAFTQTSIEQSGLK